MIAQNPKDSTYRWIKPILELGFVLMGASLSLILIERNDVVACPTGSLETCCYAISPAAPAGLVSGRLANYLSGFSPYAPYCAGRVSSPPVVHLVWIQSPQVFLHARPTIPLIPMYFYS